MTEIARTDNHGRTGRSASVTRVRTRRKTTPAMTGSKTIVAIVCAMPAPSRGMYFPASQRVSSGVRTGARSVDIEVIATDSATSPRAR